MYSISPGYWPRIIIAAIPRLIIISRSIIDTAHVRIRVYIARCITHIYYLRR